MGESGSSLVPWRGFVQKLRSGGRWRRRGDDSLWRALRHACARSGVSGLSWARPLLSDARVYSVEGWVQRVQGSERSMLDMVVQGGCERRVEGHGE
jgi:hypothetical protein